LAKQIVHKDLRELVREIEGMGFRVHRGNGNHMKVYDADGKYVYSLPTTPGRGRWKQNLLAELKRRGIHQDNVEDRVAGIPGHTQYTDRTGSRH
jgi:hypothetical protein